MILYIKIERISYIYIYLKIEKKSKDNGSTLPQSIQMQVFKSYLKVYLKNFLI